MFIAENVHSGDVVDIDHKRNLYRVIVGSVGVQLALRDIELAGMSRAKTGEISAAAKTIQQHVPSGMTVDQFIALPVASDIDAQIAQQEQTVAAAREATAIASRTALGEFPSLQFDYDALVALLSTTIDDLSQEAAERVDAHLAAHGMTGGQWIVEGLPSATDSCPFCGQNLNGLRLIDDFRAVFSTRYRALLQAIIDMGVAIETPLGEANLSKLAVLAAENRAAGEFWKRYCTFEEVSSELAAGVADAAAALRRSALALIEQKSRVPLEPVQVDTGYLAAFEQHREAQRQVTAANSAIRATNTLIAAKKAEAASANLATATAQLARLQAIKTRHNDDVASLCASHAALVAEKAAIDGEKATVRGRLDTHTETVVAPYEQRINALLSAFNAGFTITQTSHSYAGGVATSSYQLMINNVAVEVGDDRTPADKPSFKNTLSSGDKATLALALFIADLERDPALEQKTVVFDDPFNSQDAFRRRQTVHEINRLASRCAQVIVFSHDPFFLKALWDKSPAAERASLSLVDHRAQGIKILPIDLDNACRGRTVNDVDDLQHYRTTGVGTPIDIVRKIRGVLETYCRSTYPASFADNDWLGEMVGKIRDGGTAHPAAALYDELDQINDYTAQYHHGERTADATPDHIDPTELTGFVVRTLRLVNALSA